MERPVAYWLIDLHSSSQQYALVALHERCLQCRGSGRPSVVRSSNQRVEQRAGFRECCVFPQDGDHAVAGRRPAPFVDDPAALALARPARGELLQFELDASAAGDEAAQVHEHDVRAIDDLDDGGFLSVVAAALVKTVGRDQRRRRKRRAR